LPHPTLCAARLSGDEFALLIDDTSGDALSATHAAWHTVRSTPVTLPDGTTIAVSASAGVAVGRLGAQLPQLLREADLAMYAAKTDNGRIRLYTTDLTAPTPTRGRPAVRARDRHHHAPGSETPTGRRPRRG
ncbi:MAG: diguanylate cyclase domain-containing protein, partial [Natronosporangium sp.]